MDDRIKTPSLTCIAAQRFQQPKSTNSPVMALKTCGTGARWKRDLEWISLDPNIESNAAGLLCLIAFANRKFLSSILAEASVSPFDSRQQQSGPDVCVCDLGELSNVGAIKGRYSN